MPSLSVTKGSRKLGLLSNKIYPVLNVVLHGREMSYAVGVLVQLPDRQLTLYANSRYRNTLASKPLRLNRGDPRNYVVGKLDGYEPQEE